MVPSVTTAFARKLIKLERQLRILYDQPHLMGAAVYVQRAVVIVQSKHHSVRVADLTIYGEFYCPRCVDDMDCNNQDIPVMEGMLMAEAPTCTGCDAPIAGITVEPPRGDGEP